MPAKEPIYLGKSDFVFFDKESNASELKFSNAIEYHLDGLKLVLANDLPHASSESKEMIVVGEVYDSRFPDRSNQDIVDGLSGKNGLGELTKALKPLGGRYFILAHFQTKWNIIGDACGQFEVFYHKEASLFASNVALVCACCATENWEGDPSKVYGQISSGDEIPIGKTTKSKSILHLLPNHFVVAGQPQQHRYFPTKENPVGKRSLVEAVDDISKTLTGLVHSFSNRYALSLPVTAGYDSRLLLAAAKGVAAQTFIFHHPKMAADFYDITVARELCNAVGRDFETIVYSTKVNSNSEALFSEAPRKWRLPVLINGMKHHFSNRLFLSGNIGEIGREYYSDLKGINASLLAKLIGFGNSEFVKREMQAWLESIDLKSLGKHNLLDLFYWEMRMGTWGALAITEYAAVSPVVSPMNSHAILSLFLEVDKKHRSNYRNNLFDGLIQKMDPRLAPFPINPNRKTVVIKLMVRLRIYNLYRNILFRLQS